MKRPIIGFFLACSTLPIALVIASCSLENIKHSDCSSDTQCRGVFGLGSKCEAGFCADPPKCKVSSDCRQFGYMATCTSQKCVPVALDARCQVFGPPAVIDAVNAQSGTADAVLIGGLFNLKTNDTDPPAKEDARAAAAELAVDEINQQGGTSPFGLIMCNYDNADGSFTDTVSLGEYLARDAGVPVIIGPSSTQATSDLATALYQTDDLETAIISPAATGTQLTLQPDRVPTDAEQGLLWRTTVSDDVQAAFLANLIEAAILPTKRVGVLYVDQQYGTSFVNVLSTSLGQDRVSSASFTGAADIGAGVEILAQATSLGAVVVVSNDVVAARAGLDAAAAQSSLSSLKFFLTDGSKDPAIGANPTAVVQPILDALRGSAPKNPTNQGFYDRLKQKSGFDASQFSFVAQSYDAVYVAAFGVVFGQTMTPPLTADQVAVGFSHLSSGSNVPFGPTSFKAGVTQLQFAQSIDVVGVSGPLNFDANGDVLAGTDDTDVWCVVNGAIANGKVACP